MTDATEILDVSVGSPLGTSLCHVSCRACIAAVLAGIMCAVEQYWAIAGHALEQ